METNLLLVALAVLGLYVFAAVLVWRVKDNVKMAYNAGRRAGLKTAANIARTRSGIALETAPRGRMMTGAVRAQMADQIEQDLLEELDKAK